MGKEELGQQSDYFRTGEDYIQDWQDLADPKRFNFEITDRWMAPAALYVREIIHKLGLDSDQRVIETDKKILELSFKFVPAYIDETDIYYEPKPTWWWYFLYDIHHGNYPLELLPDYLKNIYKEHLKNLGKLSEN